MFDAVDVNVPDIIQIDEHSNRRLTHNSKPTRNMCKLLTKNYRVIERGAKLIAFCVGKNTGTPQA